jgi:hypothetical protein
MGYDLSLRKSVARRLALAAVFLTPLFLGACGGYHMITRDAKPSDYAVKSQKATLVIIRSTNWSGSVGTITIGPGHIVTNYLDKKMIGQTRGKSYFVTEVKPGTHYIMAQSQNTAVARLNFETGKVYVLQQLLFPSLNPFKDIPRTGFTPMNTQDFMKEIKDSDFLVYDKAHPGDDLPQKDFQEAKDDFEKEAKEDPGRHKDTLHYKGSTKL